MTDIYNYIQLLDIRISADASRRLQLKAAACQTFAVYQENHGYPLHVQVILIIIILRMRRSVTDIPYIYTHRESLLRNHEPCAKALGNYYIYIIIYLYIIYIIQNILKSNL